MGTHSPACSIFKEMLLKGLMLNSVVIKLLGSQEEFPTVGCGNVPGFGLFRAQSRTRGVFLQNFN